MRRFILLILISVVFDSSVHAATLPTNMSTGDFDRVVEVLGYGSTVRVMRSAEPYPLWPGIKLGMEMSLTPSRSIESQGAGNGSFPSLIPAPRFYLAKGLGANWEFIFSFFFPRIVDTLSTVGGIVKYSFYNEQESFLSAAAYFGYTKVSAFSSLYTGSNLELGVYLSKDYVRIKPFLGAAALFAHGEVPAAFSPLRNSGWDSTFHFFIGTEIELPVNVTAQLDWINLNPMGSLAFTYHFI